MPSIDLNRLPEIVADAAKFLEGFDREFYERVWETDLCVFERRLKAIDFHGLGPVLDAGSGNGQWALCLAGFNEHVSAVDISQPRLDATHRILTDLGYDNFDTRCESIDSLSFPDTSFDAIFCYSALYFANHKKTLPEFFRVLRPGGRLYICTNGPGWYINNMIQPHNPSSNHDVRQIAIDAIANTIKYFSEGIYSAEHQLAVPSTVLRDTLHDVGFESIEVTGEGELNPGNIQDVKRFFPSSLFGLEAVYEVLCRKPRV